MTKNYKRLYLFLYVCIGVVSTALGQYTVTLRIVQQPVNHSRDTIFLAGNLNKWHPADSDYQFAKSGQYPMLSIKNLPQAIIEFKCTRGSWEKPESTFGGADINNRAFNIISDTTIDLVIAGWKDDFAPTEKQHTASQNVHLLDSAFAVRQLNTTRRIWIYLPPGYAASNKKYPVMYLHDGQNIFDAYTAAYGEWGVDEILDSMIKKGAPACIVVGIDNGPERMQEYNPYDALKFGKGKGDLYLEFLTETLKPFIDKHYRTLPQKENTIIAGSSMGGLISFYALLKYPGTFGAGGIFSPAFWVAEGIKSVTDSTAGELGGKLFFYMGGLEGATYLADMNQIVETVGKKSGAMVYAVIDPDGQHNEQAWHKWFTAFYKWTMADGFNHVIDLEK